MTLWTNNFNGIASGTAVTTGNSGGTSGTAFTAVQAITGGSLTAASAAAFEGATGLQLVWPATSIIGYVNWGSLGGTAGTRLSGAFWHRFSAAPSTSDQIANIGATIRLTSTGAYTVSGTATAGATVLATSTAVTAGSWTFIQWASTAGSTTANGRVEARIWKQDGTNLLTYDSGNVANTGTNTTSAFFGRSNAITSAYTSSYDSLAVSNALTSGFPGDPAPVPSLTGGLKVWSGTTWTVKPVKVWTGSAWVAKPVKRWNGSSWVTLP